MDLDDAGHEVLRRYWILLNPVWPSKSRPARTKCCVNWTCSESVSTKRIEW